jgi:hypothetical protein
MNNAFEIINQDRNVLYSTVANQLIFVSQHLLGKYAVLSIDKEVSLLAMGQIFIRDYNYLLQHCGRNAYSLSTNKTSKNNYYKLTGNHNQFQ